MVKVRGRIGLHSNLTVWLNTEARLGPPWENCLLQTSTYPLVISWLYIYSIVFSLSKTVLLLPVVVLLAGVVGGTASMGITVL